jgi:hypothetical protein
MSTFTVGNLADSGLGSLRQAVLDANANPGKGGGSFDWFFLAMSHWQLGNKEEARRWHDRAVEWMDKNRSTSAPLIRYRAEAEGLLNITSRTSTTNPNSK